MEHKAFINRVSKVAEIEREDCEVFEEALGRLLEKSLVNGESVSIPAFGNFETRKRKERIISHPSGKGRRLLVPPKVVVNFKPSAILKNKINQTSNPDEL